MTTKKKIILVALEVEGDEADAVRAVSKALDTGFFQGEIMDNADVKVTSAIVTVPRVPTYDVGDKVEVGDEPKQPGEVIETNFVQQIRIRYQAGHQSVFYPSFIYQPWKKP